MIRKIILKNSFWISNNPCKTVVTISVSIVTINVSYMCQSIVIKLSRTVNATMINFSLFSLLSVHFSLPKRSNCYAKHDSNEILKSVCKTFCNVNISTILGTIIR